MYSAPEALAPALLKNNVPILSAIYALFYLAPNNIFAFLFLS